MKRFVAGGTMALAIGITGITVPQVAFADDAKPAAAAPAALSAATPPATAAPAPTPPPEPDPPAPEVEHPAEKI